MSYRNITSKRRAEILAKSIYEELKPLRIIIDGVPNWIMETKAIQNFNRSWDIAIEIPWQGEAISNGKNQIDADFHLPIPLWKVKSYANADKDVEYNLI